IDLSPDYNPEMIPRRLEFGALALGGLVIGVAVLVLGMVSVRRAPAVAFGILVAAVTYSPTSNLLFSSGTALAERALYLAVLAPAMTIGWLVVVVPAMHRRVLWIGVAALASVYTVRTVTRIPFWRDMRTVILEDVLLHPHNYRSYVRVASTFELIGDSAKALQYYRMAAAVFPDDPYVARRLVPLARALDRPYLALREAERSLAMDPGHSHLNRLTVETLWYLELRDSAVTVARSFVERRLSTASVKLYLELLERRGGGGGGGDPDWRVALVRSRLAWIEGRPHAASGEIDAIREGELLVGAGTERDFCWDLEQARGLLLTLAPDLLDVALEEVASGSLRCALI
ncbi:MAG: tetratricopeptide repeat protein, partial [Gemmatimonadales bacterium]